MQWTDNNGTNQQFRLADSDGGYVRLINRNSGKAVEVQGASTADGGNIVQYDDWNGTNQQWQLVRVGGDRPRRRPTPAGGTLHQPGGLAGLRRRRHHPRRRRLLLLGLDHALLAGRADPALVRPGELGVSPATRCPGWTSAPTYDLNGGRGYVKGIWASTLNYRPSNSTFYWLGCIEFNQTYVYTAPPSTAPGAGTRTINNCYYDAGLLIDDNDTMYVAYGNSTISVAQLSAGRAQPGPRPAGVHQTPSSIGTLEGVALLQAQRQLLHLRSPARPTASTS